MQTFSRFGRAADDGRARVWMFGFQRRRVRRCECEMLLPKPGPLPQTSQVAATVEHSPVRSGTVGSPADRGCASRRTRRRAEGTRGTSAPGANYRRRRHVGTGGYPAAALSRGAGRGACSRRLVRTSGALEALGRAREEIDALNVFPVPDGDTGTNLFLTMESAVEERRQRRPDDGDVGSARPAKAMAHGALLGARGNSGVILSQLLRGAVEVLAGSRRRDRPGRGPAHGAGARGAEPAYAAVAEPVEGTILTRGRAAAEAAGATARDGLAEVVSAAAHGRPVEPSTRTRAAARGAPRGRRGGRGRPRPRRSCWTPRRRWSPAAAAASAGRGWRSPS